MGDGGALLLTKNRGKSRTYENILVPMVDDPNFASASILAPNMVITVEPGMRVLPDAEF